MLHKLGGDDLQAAFGFTPQVVVASSLLPNAYARRPGTIVLTQGLLEVISSEDEFAFVLAHELGHLVLGHERRRPLEFATAAGRVGSQLPSRWNEHLTQELDADAFAADLLGEAGYEKRAGVTMIERLANGLGEMTFGSRIFPSLGQRVQRLRARLE